MHTAKDSFFPLSIVQWNALPESVVSLPSLDIFRGGYGGAMVLGNFQCCGILGPVVESIVSLTSLLRGQHLKCFTP